MITIYFVHGFWVQKDSRGMFPEIEKYLKNIFSDIQFEYTELNHICENGTDTKVLAFSQQAWILDEKLERSKEANFNIIIAHSQGCVISSLLINRKNISLGIFLAPPSENDFSALLERMGKRPGSFIDVLWESILRRSDGSMSYIPAEYFSERSWIDYEEMYTYFRKNIPSYLIQAKDDEIIQSDNISKLWYKETFLIWWNHNFDDTLQNRNYLLEIIWNIMKENYLWKS